MKSFAGVLEIDQQRGVIYFHEGGCKTVLRIQNLPKPIPDLNKISTQQLDINVVESIVNYDENRKGKQ